MAVDVAVAVAVAGVITVGHGHEDDQDHVHDHHRSLPLSAGLDHGKARPVPPLADRLQIVPSRDTQLGQNMRVTKDEALKVLADAEVVPCVSAGIADAKEIIDVCLAAGIPAILDRQDSCHGHGHAEAVRIDLCVRPEDLPKVMAIMHARWQSLLDQEGTVPSPTAASAESEDPPCPACGTAAPLQDGACTGCGLQLE